MMQFPKGRSRLSVLCALILATQLAGCGGSSGGNNNPNTPAPPPSGGGNNTPPPQPPPPAPETVSLKLTGKVTDEPIAFAEVTATVGTETFTTTAAADGAYSLDIEIEEANVGAFVTLNARGVGDQAFVEFTSLAGSFQSLVSQAGDDATLSNTENFSTQITNVSTAQAVFIREANGGIPITSDATLRSLASRINAQDVLDLAAAIKLAVDDAANNPLPEGQTSILALAADAAARKEFINQVYTRSPAAFAAAQVAIAQDPNLSQPLEADVIAAYLANEGFTTALLSNDAAFSFNYTGRVSHFDLFEGGVGSESSETYEQEFTWTIEGSTIKVTYTEPVVTYSWDEGVCGSSPPAQYQGRYVTDGATISFLNARTVAITTTSDITYLACPGLDKENETSTVARTVLSMDNFNVIDIEEIKDQAQTIYVWNGEAVVADVAEINADGTGRALLTGQDFTWELNADGGPEEQGKIVQVTFADSTEAEYLSLRDIDDLASDIFWEVRVAGGAVLMGAGASVFADPDYAVGDFTADQVPGRYYQFGIGEEVSGDPRLKGFRLRFDESGLMGAEENDTLDGNGEVLTTQRAFRWSVENGPVGREIVVQRTVDTSNWSYNCVLGSSVTCGLIDERRIIPLVANDDGRYYWIEVRRIAPLDAFITDSTPATHLVRFYDFKGLADAAPAGASFKPQFTPKAASNPRELLQGPRLR